MTKSFAQLQTHLAKHAYLVADVTKQPRTLVFISGMSLDTEELAKVKGIEHYEERLLYVIGYLRNPRTQIIFISSRQIQPRIIQYYSDLFCTTPAERRSFTKRLILMSVGSSSSGKTVTQKLLSSTRLRQQILQHVPNKAAAVLRCFNSSPDEQALAVKLGLPLFAADPTLAHVGSKSGSREVFKALNLALPFGIEHIHSANQLYKAVSSIKRHDRSCKQVVLKFNNSFSGVGNAILSLDKWPKSDAAMAGYLKKHLRASESDLSSEKYLEKFYASGGIAEEWLSGDQMCSPSAQVVIHPDKTFTINSTHEQLLDRETKQVYLGARFPARPKLRPQVVTQAKSIAAYLAKHGVIGPFSIDFMSVKRRGRWTTHPIELNLRKGGTTHPYQLVQMLTQAVAQPDASLRTKAGRKLYYYAYDNISSKDYVGIELTTLIDLVRDAGLAFDHTTNIGVTLHLLGALQRYGKFGAVCIARSPQAAEQLFLLLQRVLAAHVAKQQQQVAAQARDVRISRQHLVDSFLRYARISSPSHAEAPFRHVLRQELVQLGVKTRVDGAGNLIGTLAGQGTVPYLLCAHMDTVKPCEQVRPVVRGNTIMTDGNSILGADDKAGVAAIMELLRVLHSSKVAHPPLEIIFSTGEETFSDGISELDFTHIQSPFALVVDGGAFGEIDRASAYLADVLVTVLGKAAHSGIEPEKGVSAIQIAAQAINHMKLGRVDHETTANIGEIKGGSIRNAVPAQVTLHGEVRSFSRRKIEDQLERMHKALEDAAEVYGGLLNISSRVAVAGYSIDRADPYLKSLEKIMKQQGIEPKVISTVGATDANTMIVHGIRAINIGTGVQNPHTTEERVNVDDLVQLTQFIYQVVVQRPWEKF